LSLLLKRNAREADRAIFDSANFPAITGPCVWIAESGKFDFARGYGRDRESTDRVSRRRKCRSFK